MTWAKNEPRPIGRNRISATGEDHDGCRGGCCAWPATVAAIRRSIRYRRLRTYDEIDDDERRDGADRGQPLGREQDPRELRQRPVQQRRPDQAGEQAQDEQRPAARGRCRSAGSSAGARRPPRGRRGSRRSRPGSMRRGFPARLSTCRTTAGEAWSMIPRRSTLLPTTTRIESDPSAIRPGERARRDGLQSRAPRPHAGEVPGAEHGQEERGLARARCCR